MVMVKTELGQKVLKDRSIALTPRQRTALVIIDGRKSLMDVMEATAAIGVAPDDLRKLVELGLIAELVPDPEAAPPAAAPPAAPPAGGGRERFIAGYQAAVRATSELGLKGMRLNMAVEAAQTQEDLVALLPKLKAVLKPERYAELEKLLAN